MADNTKWKNFLLKSGIPLEYEVKLALDSRNCISNYEYSYRRLDENRVLNEFSYDIDASLITTHCYFDLMVECKYRHRSNNWLFVPSTQTWHHDALSADFIHASDYFTKRLRHPFHRHSLEGFAPVAAKGIELTPEGPNPKTLAQAVNQLSYALAEKVVDGMMHQVDELLGTSDVIFYHVPVIVTTADLYMLKPNVRIGDIELASNIEDVAANQDSVVLEVRINKDLAERNAAIFGEFIGKYRRKLVLNKEIEDRGLEFIMEVVAQRYTPRAILILNHTAGDSVYDKLFDLLKKIDSSVNASLKTNPLRKSQDSSEL